MSAAETIRIGRLDNPPVPSANSGAEDPAALSLRRVQARMIQEVEAMLIFATANGIGVPVDLVAAAGRALGNTAPAIGDDRLTLLAKAHLDLTMLIAPARAGTVLLLIDDRRRHPFVSTFGAVPMARWMLGIAVLSFLAFLVSALPHAVNSENLAKGLLNLGGSQLLLNELFLAAAAGVGASLANLKRLGQYISACTYSQRYDGSYWTRLVMGLISGLVLSQLLFSGLAAAGAPLPGSGEDNLFLSLGQPALALFGGFSAELVHDILSHFIDTIGTLLGVARNKTPRDERSGV